MTLFDAVEKTEFKPDRLYLIDAMALAYRSHFIFISRPLINSKGMNTSATYGFTIALLKLIEDHSMDNMAVVFDALTEGGTFRDAMYDQYKAQRSPMPEDLIANLPWIKDVVRALDIPVIEVEGVEADDVIGTLALRAQNDGAQAIIVSPDKDFQQLLSPAVTICRPAHRGEEFDPITEDSFREKFGVEPPQFIDILALMGDAVDNVPGVPGIGEKTAVTLIQEYGTVENLLAHAEDVKGKKAREGLLGHKADAVLSKALVTIKTDVELDIDWHACRRRRADEQQLARLFGELEFSNLMRRIPREKAAAVPEPTPTQAALFDALDPSLDELATIDSAPVDYRAVVNMRELEDLSAVLSAVDRVSINTETTSTDANWASLVGITVSWQKGSGRYIPTPMPDGTPTEAVLAGLAPALQEKKLIGQNLKFDLIVLEKHGLRLEGALFDTTVAHYLLSPEEAHTPEALARKYLHYRVTPRAQLLGSGKTQLSVRDVPVDAVARFTAEDTDVALQLADIFESRLEEAGLTRVANEIEMPLVRVLADVEIRGITISRELLAEISRQLREEMLRLESEIYQAAGTEFQIGSTQQLSEILFDRLKLNVISKTSTGKPSTREMALQELATEHPLPGLILDWREVTKLRSTYVDTLPELIHPETGRVHTCFNQTVAATGRLSSSNPNLQNIPVRTEMGREIRKAFVPAPGMKLLSADYVQIELRIMASMSGDEALIEAFRGGFDIHTATASRVLGIPIDQITRDQRRKAKEVNYGIPYGVSGFGLAQRLRMPVREAQELIDSYKRSYPRVAMLLVALVEEAREKGYAETLMGRRRYVPNINARNRTERSFAERVAVNMPIQGTQADMIKIAMVRLHQRIRSEGLKSRMLLQVHDELLFEVPPEEQDVMREIVRSEMEQALPLKDVAVDVDLGFGDNWLDAH